MSNDPKKLIGRIEKIDFPDWSIAGLDAKIDTGAYTSSLHCHSIKLTGKSGYERVQFSVLDPDHPEYEKKQYTCDVLDIRKVKSSNGISEDRVVIKQNALFFNELRVIELSLTDRSGMRYPVLLGRKFLKKYIIDSSRKYISLQL